MKPKDIDSNHDISLTDKGIGEASKTALGQFMDFLNSHPGLAILIPFVSLVLAVFALSISAS